MNWALILWMLSPSSTIVFNNVTTPSNSLVLSLFLWGELRADMLTTTFSTRAEELDIMNSVNKRSKGRSRPPSDITSSILTNTIDTANIPSSLSQPTLSNAMPRAPLVPEANNNQMGVMLIPELPIITNISIRPYLTSNT